MRLYKFCLLIVSIALCSSQLLAQSISGPTIVSKNTVNGYTNLDFGSCDPCTFFWNVTGGPTIITETESQLSLEWSSDGYYQVQLWKKDPPTIPEMVEEINVIVGERVEYLYDAAGNRVRRMIVYLSSSTKKSLSNGSQSFDPIEENLEDDTEEDITDQMEGDGKFKVYPNPVRQSLFVSLNTAAVKNPSSRIIVFDNLGRQLVQMEELDEVVQIDMSSLPNGVYILKLIYGSKSKDCKIIKY